MKRIKVMHLIWSMGAGGAQQIVLNYLRDFQNDPDIEMMLCVYTAPTSSKYDQEIKEKNYNVRYLNNPKTKIQIPYIRRFFQQPISQKAWADAIREFAPDIVHIHISALLRAVMPGINQQNVPVRFDTLHSNPYRYKGSIKRIIVNAFQNQNVIPICITEAQVLAAKAHYGIKSYEILRNGIDIELIRERCCDKKSARVQFDIQEDAFVVIGVGRLHPIKRFDLLLESFAEICKIRENVVLLIAGDGPEKKRLIRKAHALGVEKSVRFLGNIDNVVTLYCAADVLALTSESEASPLVALEAQTCGTRCVLSAGVPEESILLGNSQQLAQGATLQQWATALLDETHVVVPTVTFEDYEVHNMSRKLKKIYMKYYAMHLAR